MLEDACEKIGRDPAEITKTRLGGTSSADRRGRRAPAARVRPAPRHGRGAGPLVAVAGDRDSVGEQIEAYLEAGLDGLVFNMHDAWDLERVALTGEVAGRVLHGAAHCS